MPSWQRFAMIRLEFSRPPPRLGLIGDRKAIRALLRQAEVDDVALASAACEALCRLGEVRGAEILSSRFLTAWKDQTRAFAVEALKRCGLSAMEAALPYLRHKTWKTRAAAAEVLTSGGWHPGTKGIVWPLQLRSDDGMKLGMSKTPASKSWFKSHWNANMRSETL